MAFLITTFKKTQSLRIAGILPKLIKPSFPTEAISFHGRKYVLSPEEANLTAKFNGLYLHNSIFNFQSFEGPTSLIRLPTLDKNVGITFHIPVNKPCIEDFPSSNIGERFDPLSSLVIEEPASPVYRKEAAKLIVIRRRKMKKHKLRKLRKRRRYIMLKYNQKKEYQKEKVFQASQMDKIRAAHAFDPVAHVNEEIRKAKEIPFPRTWKGKRLPKEVIRILIENDGKYVHPKDK